MIEFLRKLAEAVGCAPPEVPVQRGAAPGWLSPIPTPEEAAVHAAAMWRAWRRGTATYLREGRDAGSCPACYEVGQLAEARYLALYAYDDERLQWEHHEAWAMELYQALGPCRCGLGLEMAEAWTEARRYHGRSS